MNISNKEKDRELILDYLKNHGVVSVQDVIDNSGADRLRVYPILYEEILKGTVIVLKEESLGAPSVISLR